MKQQHILIILVAVFTLTACFQTAPAPTNETEDVVQDQTQVPPVPVADKEDDPTVPPAPKDPIVELGPVEETTFDSCGSIDKYSDQNWYNKFSNQVATSKVSDACLSLDGNLLIAIIPGGYCEGPSIYRYRVAEDTIEEAVIDNRGRGCLASPQEFGKREGSVIRLGEGFGGDAGVSAVMEFDYNYSTNIVTLIKSANWYGEERPQHLNWTYYDDVWTKLCTDKPTTLAIGRDAYPIADEYVALPFLGQIFTAYECGPGRLSQIYGVRDDLSYVLGSGLSLRGNPSNNLMNTLQSLGFACATKGQEPTQCQRWELWDELNVYELLKLEPFYKELKSDDCRNCG